MPGPKFFMTTMPQDLDQKLVSFILKIWIICVPSISELYFTPDIVRLTTGDSCHRCQVRDSLLLLENKWSLNSHKPLIGGIQNFLVSQAQILRPVTLQCYQTHYVQMYHLCTNEPQRRKKSSVPWGSTPGEHWEVDFTEIKPMILGYKYLLVFIDIFSKWIEIYILREWRQL